MNRAKIMTVFCSMDVLPFKGANSPCPGSMVVHHVAPIVCIVAPPGEMEDTTFSFLANVVVKKSVELKGQVFAFSTESKVYKDSDEPIGGSPPDMRIKGLAIPDQVNFVTVCYPVTFPMKGPGEYYIETEIYELDIGNGKRKELTDRNIYEIEVLEDKRAKVSAIPTVGYFPYN